jgi:putative chitinase
MITSERMRKLAPACRRALVARVAPLLEECRGGYEVVTPMRVAHLMAQLCYESAYFTRLEENLNYTSGWRIGLIWPRLRARAQELAGRPAALANAAYANKLGNGGEASGDGWRYRGRGLIQLTGRENYRRYSAAALVDLEANPDLAADPEVAVVVALAYWREHNCNAAADCDNSAAVSLLINGAGAGMRERRALTARAKEIFMPEEGENK